MNIFGDSGKIFRPSVKVCSMGLSKLNSTCPEKQLRKNSFFLFLFSDTERNIFGLLLSSFRGIVKNAFYVSIGTFCRVIFLTKKIFSRLFRTLSKNFSAFRQKIFGGIFETSLYLSWRAFQCFENFSQNMNKIY